MGGHYGSVQVRTTDRAAVKAAVESVAAGRKIRCLVGPELNGWVGVYPEGSGQDESVGREVAGLVDADVLQVIVHDDDVMAYWLWRKRLLVDSYWSNPGILGDENTEDERSRCGDAEQFRVIVGDDVEKLAKVLDRNVEFTFEGHRLGKFAKLLGMSNAVTEYDYLVSGERAGIKGWRKFEKVPPDPVKPRTPTRNAIRKQLKKSGLLLYSQEWKIFPQVLRGLEMGEGFVLGWENPWSKTAELFRLTPPKFLPEVEQFDEEVTNAQLEGNFAVKHSDDVLRIVDRSVTPWKTVAEITAIDGLQLSAISPSGEFVAHSNAQQIVVRRVPSGDQVFEIRRGRTGKMVFHPSEPWVVASGDCLALFRVDGTPGAMDFRVGGNAAVSIGNVRGIEEPGCIGFTKDGKFLWCATNVGMRIYEWETLRSNLHRRPRWRLILRGKTSNFWEKQITAVAQDVEGPGILLGTFSGKLAWFDLQTGELYQLLDLPGGGRVQKLLFSKNGNFLAVATQIRPDGSTKVVRAWEVWDYRKLREAGKFLSRCEKRVPVAPSQDDLLQWRRGHARGDRSRTSRKREGNQPVITEDPHGGGYVG